MVPGWGDLNSTILYSGKRVQVSALKKLDGGRQAVQKRIPNLGRVIIPRIKLIWYFCRFLSLQIPSKLPQSSLFLFIRLLFPLIDPLPSALKHKSHSRTPLAPTIASSTHKIINLVATPPLQKVIQCSPTPKGDPVFILFLKKQVFEITKPCTTANPRMHSHNYFVAAKPNSQDSRPPLPMCRLISPQNIDHRVQT